MYNFFLNNRQWRGLKQNKKQIKNFKKKSRRVEAKEEGKTPIFVATLLNESNQIQRLLQIQNQKHKFYRTIKKRERESKS